jgi:hypothetical protein
MEKFQEIREIGKKKLEVAEYMLTQTYPNLKEPKLLLSIMDSIFLALSNLMGSILYYDRTFKKVPPFQETPDARLAIFQTKSMRLHKIDKKYVNIFEEIKETLILHKKSPVEFIRNDKIVICDNDYSMKTVSLDKIREYLYFAKEFLMITNNITQKNEEIFNMRGNQNDRKLPTIY